MVDKKQLDRIEKKLDKLEKKLDSHIEEIWTVYKPIKELLKKGSYITTKSLVNVVSVMDWVSVLKLVQR